MFEACPKCDRRKAVGEACTYCDAPGKTKKPAAKKSAAKKKPAKKKASRKD